MPEPTFTLGEALLIFFMFMIIARVLIEIYGKE